MLKFNKSKLPPQVAVKTKQVLRGSGVTKKLAISAEKQFEAAQRQKFVPETSAEVLANVELMQSLEQSPALDTDVLDISRYRKNKIADDWQWDDSQLAAIHGVLNQQFSVIIGPAGSGKTTVLREIIEQLETTLRTIDIRIADATKMRKFVKDGGMPEAKPEDYALSIAFCAFTGRAVQQMKRALPKKYHIQCNTIHSTLGFHPEYFEIEDASEPGGYKTTMRFVPHYTQANPLPFQVIVMDETGMTGIDLWNLFWDAIKSNTRIIFVGDINQLPPVHDRSVLGFAMNKWPTYELTVIHRQALDNPIIAAAHAILDGKMPTSIDKKFKMLQMPMGSLDTFKIAIKAIKILHRDGDFNPVTDTVIVPQNKDTLGQSHFNDVLVQYFNAPKNENGVSINKRRLIHTGIGNNLYAVGDKVMVLNNDRERGLTNGMTGIIVSIGENAAYRTAGTEMIEFDAASFMQDINAKTNIVTGEMEDDDEEEEKDRNQREASHVVAVDFETGEEIVFHTAGDFRKLALAYAVTCHKSQGGEYPTVVVLCHSANDRMLCREWLYTAVTRGAEYDILLFNELGLAQALARQRVKGKNLAEKIASFQRLAENTTAIGVKVPMLPEPREMQLKGN